jgi:hypothetical protein
MADSVNGTKAAKDAHLSSSMAKQEPQTRVDIGMLLKLARTEVAVRRGPADGFYANVNPELGHPRWTEANERRIGEFFRRETLVFNGYGPQLAQYGSRHGPEKTVLAPLALHNPKIWLVGSACYPCFGWPFRAGQWRPRASPVELVAHSTGTWTLTRLMWRCR